MLLSLNMVAGSWHIENKERGFKTLRSQRNLSNNLPDDVVDSLLEAVRRRRRLLQKVLHPEEANLKVDARRRNLHVGRSQRLHRHRHARRQVLVGRSRRPRRKGYNKFSPTMAKLFMDMVNEKRIDVPAQDGKRGGAYCSSSFGSGPFQLLNFTGTQRDVATLAHESRHERDFILCYEQGILQFHPPLTLAETASIFGEMIVFRDLLEKTPSDADRLAMIMSKVDDIINSVVRQCSFDRFEEKVHSARANGQLTPEEMSTMWLECTKEYYGEEGEVFDSYADISALWMYVSHFHNVPFYVSQRTHSAISSSDLCTVRT